MQKRNKLIFLVLSEISFLLIIFILLPSIFIKERPGVSQTKFSDTLSLDTINSYSQEFITDQNNLRSISVQLKNPAIANKSKVKIELIDQSKNTVRALDTSGISIGDPSWINFEFPYINSKIGDIFFIKISTENQELDKLAIYGDRKSNNINYKTTYTASNLKESFVNNLNFQKQQIENRGAVKILLYLLTIIFLNIIFFISLL